jgi:hypothetical protein
VMVTIWYRACSMCKQVLCQHLQMSCRGTWAEACQLLLLLLLLLLLRLRLRLRLRRVLLPGLCLPHWLSAPTYCCASSSAALFPAVPKQQLLALQGSISAPAAPAAAGHPPHGTGPPGYTW